MGTDGRFSTGFGVSNDGFFSFLWFVNVRNLHGHIPILFALGSKIDARVSVMTSCLTPNAQKSWKVF